MPNRLCPRSPIAEAGRDVLDVISYLGRSGCRVLDAHVLPHPAVRVDRAPKGLDTWGHLQPPPGVKVYPCDHIAIVRGVRVVWFAASTPTGGYRYGR